MHEDPVSSEKRQNADLPPVFKNPKDSSEYSDLFSKRVEFKKLAKKSRQNE